MRIESNNNSGGAKFLDLLTILFIALKLMGYIVVIAAMVS